MAQFLYFPKSGAGTTGELLRLERQKSNAVDAMIVDAPSSLHADATKFYAAVHPPLAQIIAVLVTIPSASPLPAHPPAILTNAGRQFESAYSSTSSKVLITWYERHCPQAKQSG